MSPQSTLDSDSNTPRILGYRFETRIMGGPDNDRPMSDWSTKLVPWHPDQLENSESRNVEPLVPASDNDKTVGYYYRHEIAGEYEAKIVEFDPHELDYPVNDVIELTTLEESEFSDPDTP